MRGTHCHHSTDSQQIPTASATPLSAGECAVGDVTVLPLILLWPTAVCCCKRQQTWLWIWCKLSHVWWQGPCDIQCVRWTSNMFLHSLLNLKDEERVRRNSSEFVLVHLKHLLKTVVGLQQDAIRYPSEVFPLSIGQSRPGSKQHCPEMSTTTLDSYTWQRSHLVLSSSSLLPNSSLEEEYSVALLSRLRWWWADFPPCIDGEQQFE